MIIFINIVVIGALAALFSGWLFKLIRSAKNLRETEARLLSSCQDAVELKTAIGGDILDIRSKGGEVWGAFALKHALSEEEPLGAHIKALFDAGLYESRLEVRELLQNTTEKLFKASGYLKQVLSSFIVIGLLGTLFGLAYSLYGISAKTNREALLEHLWIAFAPSIGGVSATILGIFIYIYYTHFFCLPLKNKLYEITVTNLIPNLIPTFSQRSMDSLRAGEETMRKTLDASKSVIEFVKDTENDISKFNTNLKKSNESVDRMFKYSVMMNDVIDAFSKDMRQLGDFQQEMARLITLFKENFERQDSYQRIAHENVIKHGAQMDALLEKVESIGKGYLNSMDKTVSALREPFLEQMEGLGQTAAKSIDKVANSLQRMEQPLKDTAQSMRESVNTLDLRITTVLTKIGSLQADMSKELGELLGKQLGIISLSGELKTLNANIAALLFNTRPKTLSEHVKNLFGKGSDTNL